MGEMGEPLSRWVEVASAGDVAPGTGRTVRVGSRCLALFNDGGEFFAMDGTCPHQGASLGEGALHAGRVICPWHSWIFDLRSGACPSIPGIAVATYPTRRTGGAVEVRVPEDSGGGSDEGRPPE